MLFWSLSLAIVGALFMVLYVVSRLTVRWLNGLYSRCIEEGKQIEFDRAIDHVTHQSWRYREVRIDGLIVGRLLESDGGTISVSGDVDIKDGEQVLIQRRLLQGTPFF